MSPRGRTEHVTLLRAAIARIEAEGAAIRDVTRTAGARPAAIPLGTGPGSLIDRVLGGGLRRGALHEIVPASPRDEAAASGFALALAMRCLAGQSVLVWIVEDRAAGESGLPYRPGLLSHGLDPDRLVLVRTHGPQATLWATEEALRTRDFVVLTELWGGRDYGLAASRRLVLAARAHGAVGLMLHAGLPGGGATLSSGSAMRFRVAAHPSRTLATVGRRLPAPGPAAFAVRLDKVQAAARDFDHTRPFVLTWNAEQRGFHDHDLSVALASSATDGPHQAAQRQTLF